MEPALAILVPKTEKAQPTNSRPISESRYEIQVPWPALANTRAGPKASEPLGPVPASDWANTSRKGSDLLRRPEVCASFAAESRCAGALVVAMNSPRPPGCDVGVILTSKD